MQYIHNTAKEDIEIHIFKINVYVYVWETQWQMVLCQPLPTTSAPENESGLSYVHYSQVWNRWDMQPLSALLESDFFFCINHLPHDKLDWREDKTRYKSRCNHPLQKSLQDSQC